MPSLGGGSRAWSQPGAHAAAVEGPRWGGAPGGADLRLGSSVREALAREVLLRNFAPTPRPAP